MSILTNLTIQSGIISLSIVNQKVDKKGFRKNIKTKGKRTKLFI